MNELKQEIAELRAELKENPEIWVPIKDNLAYFISNKGRVKTYYDYYPKIGRDKNTGYSYVYLNSKRFQLHRLLAKAFIPNPEGKPYVDHIDGNKQNNDLSNLRWATYIENGRNKRIQSNNTSGYTGVTFNKEKRKYVAQIWINCKPKHLGYFHTKEEAAAAYEAAAKEAFGEFYRKT